MGAILITGGAKRIGNAIALKLAEAGWDIALHYRSSTREAEESADIIRGLGRKCEIFFADFSKMPEVKRLVPNVLNQMPDLDGLVNNVSLFGRATLMETTEELFDSYFQINLKSPFFLSQSFAELQSKGHIINILDTRISSNKNRYFVYSMTKKALYAFTRMAALELGPDFRVNGIAPGLILPSEEIDQDQFETMGKKLPLGKTGSADDIAEAALFLMQSKFITGECLYIDGGENIQKENLI